MEAPFREQRQPYVPVGLEEQRVRREPQGGPCVRGTRDAIGVIGAGWVGLVTAACFAELGHHVYVRDIVQEKVESLARGEVPIYEPGLSELLAKNSSRLSFTTAMDDVLPRAQL